jgi:hypothetical protein
MSILVIWLDNDDHSIILKKKKRLRIGRITWWQSNYQLADDSTAVMTRLTENNCNVYKLTLILYFIKGSCKNISSMIYFHGTVSSPMLACDLLQYFWCHHCAMKFSSLIYLIIISQYRSQAKKWYRAPTNRWCLLWRPYSHTLHVIYSIYSFSSSVLSFCVFIDNRR